MYIIMLQRNCLLLSIPIFNSYFICDCCDYCKKKNIVDNEDKKHLFSTVR